VQVIWKGLEYNLQEISTYSAAVSFNMSMIWNGTSVQSSLINEAKSYNMSVFAFGVREDYVYPNIKNYVDQYYMLYKEAAV